VTVLVPALIAGAGVAQQQSSGIQKSLASVCPVTKRARRDQRQ